MIRSIPRSLLLRSVSRTSSLTFRKPVFVVRRQYAGKKSPPGEGQPISDYIASQPSPSNPETPPDRMLHQTEEDIATEKILNKDPTTSNGDVTPAEGVPVEDIFNDDPAAMNKAPKVIKHDGLSRKAEGQNVADQGSQGHNGLPHVTEETIATERIITGGEASGASNTTPGEETPAMGVPIEEAIGDGEKPAVMEESAKDDDDAPPSGQNIKTYGTSADSTSTGEQENLDPTETARKSILDLFGPASGKKARQPPPSPPSEIKQENFNPLSAHQLDQSEIDLAPWEEARRKEEKLSNENLDPDEWADTKRGRWETEEEVESPQEADESFIPGLSVTEIQATYRKRTQTQGQKPFDLHLPKTETRPISPYDYFYPPPPPPKSLETLLRRQYEQRKPSARRKPIAEAVYDPFVAKEKQVRWPWILNRDQLVDICTNHLMRHGKKATAEKMLQDVFLRILAQFPRRHPVTFLAEAIDKNAPLLKNTTVRVALKQTVIPFALNERQRIRSGWTAMIRNAAKGDERASPFTERLANEVIKAFEGRGGGMQNRTMEHRRAMQNKLNIKLPKKITRR
jgi:ribosomal protein S7